MQFLKGIYYYHTAHNLNILENQNDFYLIKGISKRINYRFHLLCDNVNTKNTLIQNLLIEDKKKEDFDQVLVISQSST